MIRNGRARENCGRARDRETVLFCDFCENQFKFGVFSSVLTIFAKLTHIAIFHKQNKRKLLLESKSFQAFSLFATKLKREPTIFFFNEKSQVVQKNLLVKTFQEASLEFFQVKWKANYNEAYTAQCGNFMLFPWNQFWRV